MGLLSFCLPKFSHVSSNKKRELAGVEVGSLSGDAAFLSAVGKGVSTGQEKIIERATIAEKGALTERFGYLSDYVESREL